MNVSKTIDEVDDVLRLY